ncbi:helix-turn-helix domain-containing protein [Demequina sp.]|uniref:helix-turn-helix domain-containing protein n=1 Tax=Demequina sp. TaxID=2050685 RepID=UPI003D0D07AD
MTEDDRTARLRQLFADHGEILTTADVAKVLGYSNQTIINYINDGEIRGFQLGGRWRLVKEELIEDLASKFNDAQYREQRRPTAAED